MKGFAITAVVAAGLLAHCQPGPGCVRGATRCSGNLAELCDADGSYQPLADCSLVSAQTGSPYVCAFVDAPTVDGPVTGHTCVPAPGGSSR